MEFLPTTRTKLDQFVNDIHKKLLNLETDEIIDIWHELCYGRIHYQLRDIEPFNDLEDSKKLNPIYIKIFNELVNKIVPWEFLTKRRFEGYLESDVSFSDRLNYNYLIEEGEFKY